MRRALGGPLEPGDVPREFRRHMKRLAQLREKRKRERGLEEPERTEYQGLVTVENGLKMIRNNGGRDIRLAPPKAR